MLKIDKTNEFPYSAECDICKDDFEHPFEGWALFLDQDYMLDSMGNYGWHLVDGSDLCYCPKCHEIDENDNLIIKSK